MKVCGTVVIQAKLITTLRGYRSKEMDIMLLIVSCIISLSIVCTGIGSIMLLFYWASSVVAMVRKEERRPVMTSDYIPSSSRVFL